MEKSLFQPSLLMRSGGTPEPITAFLWQTLRETLGLVAWGFVMPAFVVCMRHAPESCPTFNEDVKKKFGAVVGKRQEVAGKQEVKILSAYTSTLDHLAWFILEAPSQQAVENYFTEIGFAF